MKSAKQSTASLLRIMHPRLRELIAIPLRRPVLMLGPLVSCIVVALLAAFLLPKQYRSMIFILVETQNVPESVVPKLVTEGQDKRLATVKQEILSRTRLERVVKELNPYPSTNNERSMSSQVETLRAATLIKLKDNDAFSIEYVHANPKKAQEVANRLATLFIETNAETRAKQVKEAREFIAARLAEARAALDQKEEEVRRYKERYMGALPQQLGANLSTLQRLQLEQETVGQNIRAVNERLSMIEKNKAEMASLPLSKPGPAAELTALRSQLADLRSRYTDEHPDVRAVRARIRRIEAQAPDVAEGDRPRGGEAGAALGEAVTPLEEARAELAQLRAKSVDLDQQIALFQSRVELTPRAEQQLVGLTRDRDKLQDNYLELVKTKMDADMSESLEAHWSGVRFKILDPANLPDHPFFPDPVLFILGGVALGLLAGGGACAGAEYLDGSIKSVIELEQLLPYAVLATVSHIAPGPDVLELAEGGPSEVVGL